MACAATLLALVIAYLATSPWLDRVYFSYKTEANAERWTSQSILLQELKATVQALPVAGVEQSLSGLTWDTDRDHLWAVSNRPTELIALDKQGNTLFKTKLDGFADTEAVAYLGDGMLAIAEERLQNIVIVDVPLQTSTIYREGLPFITLNLADKIENKNVEGLGYDIAGDRLFVTKERDPMSLIEIGGFRKTLEGGMALSIRDHKTLINDKVFTTDLASVTFAPQYGNMLLLSEQSKTIIEFNGQNKVIAFSALNSGFAGLEESIPQPEGMTVDDKGNLFVVSEPNLFYRFERM
ncbi:SdiA-regulated domain-containing protein [Halopseudomonas pelagia]|uniref:DNA-binding protein n=1 Tax=Halopseudomonas pelagia TaxID=553151 RepID=A0AA91U095_9GAMM|nr:SdiA-regulated domain-containing protein [Halopseudomonas pelagia]PCC98348.1 DNA-binding protein [Halopseudomonas pelagia]QFY56639.1 DNA-binding protein [Halopseudomonas pelagia]